MSVSSTSRASRRGRVRGLALLVAGASVVAACSGGDNLSSAGNDSPTTTQATTTTAAAVTTSTDAGTTDTSGTTVTTDAVTTTTDSALLDSLPGCDVSLLDGASGTVEITFWHALSNENGAKLEELVNTFNASQSAVKVNLQFQGGYDENATKYLQSNQDSRPNVVQLPEYMVQQMIDTKSIVPATACINSAGYDLSPFLQQPLDAYATEGIQWSMPFNMSVPVLFYLRPDFVQAGLDPDAPPQNFAELLEVSKQIVASGAATYSIALDSDFDGGGGWYVEQWLSKGGHFYADNDNGRAAPATKVLYDEAAGVELMTYLQSLVTEANAVYVGDNASGQDTLLQLANADAPAAMAVSTSAALGTVLAVLGNGLIAGITTEDVGVGPMPGPDNANGALVGGNSLYIVDKDPLKVAATWKFIEYLESAEFQSEFAAASGYVPVRSDALDLDPIKSVYVNDPRFKVAYDQLLSAPDSPTSAGPVLGPLQAVRRVTAAAVAEVLTGADPQTAMTNAAEQANALIENYNLTNS